jgi:SAM-dependent methyltransferase
MAHAAKRGTLDMVTCESCGFTWNRAFDSDVIGYDDCYENDQTYSPAFLTHVKERAKKVVSAVPVGEPIDYLEIGCGQGGFIGEIALAAGTRLRSADGFDPAWRGADGEGPNGSRIHKVYFDARTAGRLRHRPNVVVTRHTIEHVPNPLVFLTSIRQALGPDSQAHLFIETPCIAWILAHEAMQDLFYEHCSIFTADALSFALSKSGFQVVNSEHVFGGQYLWAESKTASLIKIAKPIKAGLGDLAGARGWTGRDLGRGSKRRYFCASRRSREFNHRSCHRH